MGVMPQSLTRTGSTKASDRASKASKKVALPMMTRARRCHREKGTRSRRAISSGAEGARLATRRCAGQQLPQLRRDGVRVLDRREVPGAGEDVQCGMWNG